MFFFCRYSVMDVFFDTGCFVFFSRGGCFFFDAAGIVFF